MGAEEGANNCRPGWVMEDWSEKVKWFPCSKTNRQTTKGHVQRHSGAKEHGTSGVSAGGSQKHVYDQPELKEERPREAES